MCIALPRLIISLHFTTLLLIAGNANADDAQQANHLPSQSIALENPSDDYANFKVWRGLSDSERLKRFSPKLHELFVSIEKKEKRAKRDNYPEGEDFRLWRDLNYKEQSIRFTAEERKKLEQIEIQFVQNLRKEGKEWRKKEPFVIWTIVGSLFFGFTYWAYSSPVSFRSSSPVFGALTLMGGQYNCKVGNTKGERGVDYFEDSYWPCHLPYALAFGLWGPFLYQFKDQDLATFTAISAGYWLMAGAALYAFDKYEFNRLKQEHDRKKEISFMLFPTLNKSSALDGLGFVMRKEF